MQNKSNIILTSAQQTVRILTEENRMAQEDNANQILQLCSSEIARHYGSQMPNNVTNNSMHYASQNNHHHLASSTDQMHNRFAFGTRQMEYGAVDDMILPSGYQYPHTIHTSSRQVQVPMHHNPISTTNGNNMSLDILAMAADLVIDRLGESSSFITSTSNDITATQPQRHDVNQSTSHLNTHIADGSRKRLSPDAVTLFPSNQSTRRIVPSLVNTDRSAHASRIVHQPSYTNRMNESSNQVINQQSFQPRLSTTTNTLKNRIMEAKKVEQIMKEAQMKERSNAKIMSCNSHPQSKMISATNNQDLQPTHSSALRHTISSQQNNSSCRGRKVGRIRRYNLHKGSYDPWEDIHVSDSSANDASIRINLNRGGKICMFPNMLDSNKQKSLSTAMHQCKLYRQYTRSQVFHEPRFHVLLSSKAAHCDTGYMYHGINMKALPLDLVPEVAEYARELAKRYNLPMDQWDIGVDMIVYRDGQDSIGWHADDTQGESVVLCVVVDAPGNPRPVHVRPKRTKPLAHGDEEIQLDIGESDGYDMDGIMQNGYEHSLPKKKSNSHRFVLLFRHGNEACVSVDSGKSITDMHTDHTQIEESSTESNSLMPLLSKLRVKPPPVLFGHPTGVDEGCELYSRRFLYSVSAHRADQRGINGNIKYGADSLVVSRQNPQLREEDGLQWLRYTSSRRQGAGALCLSYSRRQPVRVFRSSNLTTCYAPPEFDGGRTSYRYDGLYLVTKVWDDDGNLMTVENDLNISVGSDQYTFHLERLETSSLADDITCNSLSIQELWNKIQVSRLLPTSPFINVKPKQDGASLPRLLSDDSSKTLKYTNTHAKMSSLYPLTTSLPLQKAAMKLKTANLNDVRTSRSCEDWNRTHDPLGSTICERNNTISGRRLHVHSYTASNRIPWTYESYPALSNTSHLLPYHPSQSTLPANINREQLIVNPQYLSSVECKPKQLKIKPKKVYVEQLERDCDFNDSKNIIKCFRLYGCLRPLLSEIAKLRTKEEKIQYVRTWRNMSREEQEQYKKVKKEESEVIKQQILNEKSRRDQELKELARRKKISITRHAKREMKKFMKAFALHSLDDAVCDIKTTPKKKTESIRRRKSLVKKKQINNTSPPRQIKSPSKTYRNSPATRVQSPPKTNKRKSTSIEDDERSMRRAKRSRLVTGPDTIRKSHHHKVKPRMVDKKSYTPKQKKVKQTTASNKQSPRRTIRTNSNDSPRKKVTSRFVTDKESGMQSLASPMVAFCRLEKRSRKRDVKVHVKWASK